MGFSGSDPVVAQIAGHNVTMSEYQSEYTKVQRQNGVTNIDEEQAEILFNSTWQSLIAEYALKPGFVDLGLDVSEAERLAVIRGTVPTQAMYGAFADPQTGVFSVYSLNNFLMTAQGNPEAEIMWDVLVDQATTEREIQKFISLLTAGTNVNALEIEAGVEAANATYSGRWAMKSFSDVPDSLVQVTDSEIRAYYERNKSAFRRLPSRKISYVEFDIEPSADDLSSLQLEVYGIGAEFAEAEDVRAYVRANRNGYITDNYYNASQIPADESELLVKGEMFGPVNTGESWRMARVLESVVAPDTISIRHIVLPYTNGDMADSLLVALRAGSDFAEAATTYSVYEQSAQLGGDVGKVPFAALADDFAVALAPAKIGDIVKIVSSDVIQLVQVYATGSRMNHYKVASIEMPVLPSEATRLAIHSAAGMFTVEAKGGLDSFKNAATETEVSTHSVDLTSAMRTVAAIPGSQAIINWAHRAEVGDVSEIFKVDNGYVVAMLTDIDDTQYTSYSDLEPTLRTILSNDKKFELMKGDVSGSTFEEMAASLDNDGTSTFEGVNFSSYYVNGMGVEPRVIGAITTLDAGSVSAPVQGFAGLYVLEVDEVVPAEAIQTAEAEKVRAESMSQRVMQQMLFSAVETLSNIEDKRGAML